MEGPKKNQTQSHEPAQHKNQFIGQVERSEQGDQKKQR